MATTAPHPPGLAACLARLGDGDDTAWSELVASGGPLLGAVCARVAGPDAGDDALHDALLAVGRRARRFRGGGDDPERAARAWLTHLATTSALQVLRTRRRAERRDRAVAADAATSIDDDAHDALERAELHALVRSELARLPAAQREAVALHHLAGEPIAAVAAVQGIAAEAAKKRVQRGVARLRERLARAGLAVVPAALIALLADTADAAPAPVAAATHTADIASRPVVTPSGALAMAAAACTPVITLLALVAWSSTDAADAPLPAGDRPPTVAIAPARSAPAIVASQTAFTTARAAAVEATPRIEPADADRRVMRVYDVSDVLELQDEPWTVQQLIQLIVATVEPALWQRNGVSIAPYRASALVVTQSPDVHTAIGELLTTLRGVDRERQRRRAAVDEPASATSPQPVPVTPR